MGTKERKHTEPPCYGEAFKAGVVRMITEQGRPSREVAAELGICIDTLQGSGSAVDRADGSSEPRCQSPAGVGGGKPCIAQKA